MYSCSFFGYREIECGDELKQHVEQLLEEMIVKEH